MTQTGLNFFAETMLPMAWRYTYVIKLCHRFLITSVIAIIVVFYKCLSNTLEFWVHPAPSTANNFKEISFSLWNENSASLFNWRWYRKLLCLLQRKIPASVPWNLWWTRKTSSGKRFLLNKITIFTESAWAIFNFLLVHAEHNIVDELN